MNLPRPALLAIPAGRFVMGAVENDKFANDTERPVHEVEIQSAIAIGKHPVTVGEYRQFMPDHALGESADLSVVNVSWIEANHYCRWLGPGFRLPTEAEWEYACRAGSRNIFPGSDDLGVGEANFYYDESGRRVGPGRRLPSGSFSANAFGFHEMLGNVCEWVQDLWHPNFIGAPDDGSARTDSDQNGQRVIRGGAWDYLPRLLRCSWRDSLAASERRDNVGFRIACDLNKATAS